jgi:hypothetical protein
MVGRVPSLLGLLGRALPDLNYAFLPLRRALGTCAETEVAREVYARLSPTDFSRGVLAPNPTKLAVLPVRGVDWSDLGSPGRVLDLRRRLATPREEISRPAVLVSGAACLTRGLAREGR